VLVSEQDQKEAVVLSFPLRLVEEFPFTRREEPSEVLSVISSSLEEWVREARARRRRGNLLHPADNPAALLLGFVDEEEALCLLLPLEKLRSATPEEWRAVGLAPEDLANPIARSRTLGFAPTFLP
jgi:hypothetical protein